MDKRIAIVIPARMGSSRFPGKPLTILAGKPMIQWVFEAAVRSNVTDLVIVATPDQEIVEACQSFGAEARLTRADHPSGTDRIAEISNSLEVDTYVNLQGDEPLISLDTIRACAQPLVDHPDIQMSSVFTVCPADEYENPAVVKVVTDLDGFALYFSRFPIPYPRGKRSSPLKKHIGIYGYRKAALQGFATWPTSELESTEGLEQLRFLEHGVRIKMVEGEASEMAVDTPEQAEFADRVLRSRHSLV